MSVEIKNYYQLIPEEFQQTGYGIRYKNEKKLNIKVPFRMLVVGASGSGKSLVTINLISLMSCFTKIILIAKNTQECLYSWLQDRMAKIEKKLKRQVLFVSNNIEDTPEADDIDPDESTLIIFDDLCSESVNKQKAISDLYIRGRKQNCSCIYITQSYFHVPSLIRKQCDYIIIKKISTVRDLKAIVREYDINDISVDDLLKMYKKIVAKGVTNFMLLDLNTNDPEYKFRWNFVPIKKIEE